MIWVLSTCSSQTRQSDDRELGEGDDSERDDRRGAHGADWSFRGRPGPRFGGGVVSLSFGVEVPTGEGLAGGLLDRLIRRHRGGFGRRGAETRLVHHLHHLRLHLRQCGAQVRDLDRLVGLRGLHGPADGVLIEGQQPQRILPGDARVVRALLGGGLHRRPAARAVRRLVAVPVRERLVEHAALGAGEVAAELDVAPLRTLDLDGGRDLLVAGAARVGAEREALNDLGGDGRHEAS